MANPSVSAKQGGTTLSSEQQQCQELARRNANARRAGARKLRKQPRRNKAEREALKKAEGKGMAVSSVQSTVPGARGTFTAASSGLFSRLIPNQNVDGGTAKQMKGLRKAIRNSKAKRHENKKAEAGVLCGKSHVHPGMGKGAHAECKMINSMTNKAVKAGAAMKGGSLLFNVDWRSSTFNQGNVSGMPCKTCYAMMCHAASVCEIDIYLCDKDNQPQKLPDPCEDGDGYSDLCERVDGNATPGRG